MGKETDRKKIIAKASILGVVVNVIIAFSKIIVGALAKSMALISEGANNFADAATSVITFVGSKLAGKHPTKEHPFGYGRIEYLAGLIIAVLILVTGVSMTVESVNIIVDFAKTGTLEVSSDSMLPVLIFAAVGAIVKFILGLYTIKQGKLANSESLIGVGKECRSDAFASVITIISSLLIIIWPRISGSELGFPADAVAGIITSLLICKAGLEVLWETVKDLIGRPGEKELALKIYRHITKTEGVLMVADMMLHNYGPDAWSGSVNVEIDHEKTVGEVYQLLHKLQLDIMHEEKVTMVFGIYAVDNDHEGVKEIRMAVAKFVMDTPHVKSFHALYLEPGTDNLYVDFIVDYELADWEALEEKFRQYMKELYPQYNIILTVETEFVG